MTNVADKPLRMIGLTRKSRGEDEGTHADQRRRIEGVCKREGFDLLRVEKEHKVSGAKQWREREIGHAIKDVEAGRADGIVVATEDRITRERLEAAIEIWQEFERIGVVFVTDDGVDSRRDDAEFSFHLNAILARKQWKAIRQKSNMGRERSVMVEGIHGGDSPPAGYSWTDRADGSKNLSGNVKHGPLTPNADAPRVVATFEARASGASRSEILSISGMTSESAVMDMLRNRVYLGEAKSGEYVKPGAHEALVSEDLFSRVQRTFIKKKASRVLGRDDSLLARVMHCGTCGHALVRDRSIGSYRCKHLPCTGKASIQAKRVEPVVLMQAMAWHAVLNPMYEVEQDAFLPVMTKNLAAALTERDEVEADETLSPLRKAQALTELDAKVQVAEALLAEAEASNGWLGMNTEAVQRRLFTDTTGALPDPAKVTDIPAAREFVREMVRVTVNPCGRAARFRSRIASRSSA
jgi:DNA invertase Pin-like site-specific DNA recombinase